jgi:hypothetical protein
MPARPKRSAQQTCENMQARFNKRFVEQPATLRHKAAVLTRERAAGNAVWESKCLQALEREGAIEAAVRARDRGWKIPAYAVTWWNEYQQALERRGQDSESDRARNFWNGMSKNERAEYKPMPIRVARVPVSQELGIGRLPYHRIRLGDSPERQEIELSEYEESD